MKQLKEMKKNFWSEEGEQQDQNNIILELLISSVQQGKDSSRKRSELCFYLKLKWVICWWDL